MPLAQHFRWELLDRAITCKQSGRSLRADALDAGIAVGGVADEREIVGYQFRIDAELRSHAVSIANHLASPIDLHDAIPANALRKSLSGVQMQIFSTRASFDAISAAEANASSASSSIIAQTANPHRSQCVLERLELRAKRRIDTLSRFVAVPKLVTKRLDDVIGGDADVRGAFVDHLQHGIEHADDGAESSILSVGEATQSVKMTEELVGSVDQMNDHGSSYFIRPE